MVKIDEVAETKSSSISKCEMIERHVLEILLCPVVAAGRGSVCWFGCIAEDVFFAGRSNGSRDANAEDGEEEKSAVQQLEHHSLHVVKKSSDQLNFSLLLDCALRKCRAAATGT